MLGIQYQHFPSLPSSYKALCAKEKFSLVIQEQTYVWICLETGTNHGESVISVAYSLYRAYRLHVFEFVSDCICP